MTIQRISTYSIHQNTLNDVTRVQASLADLQGQISSGKKTNNFKGLGSQTEHFVSLEAKMNKGETYVNNNTVILSRLNTTQVVMDGAIDLVDDMKVLMLQRLNLGNENGLHFNQQLNAMRDQLGDMLNTTLEGRYLFGGTNTSAPPIGDTFETLQGNVADSSYYQGSPEDVMARLDDAIELKYSVRADDEAFQKVVAAITGALGDDAAGIAPNVQDAFQLIQEGLGDLIGVQARVNANIVTVETITTRHQELNLYWQGVKDQIINTDIVAASTQVAIDQAVLQASFQSFSTINRLRLVDFL